MTAVARRVSAAEGYARWAPTYATEANPLLALQERAMAPLWPQLAGRRVVDLACGSGRWLEKMAALRPASLVGCDFTFGMLQRARDIPQLSARLIHADCARIPLASRCADVILCSLALDHIADLEGFAAEVARIAAPGAVFLLSEFHPEAHARGWRRTFDAGGEVLELDVQPRPLAAVHVAFEGRGFRLEDCVEPAFGEPERPLFAARGRLDLYQRAAGSGPALFLSRFRRLRPPLRLRPSASSWTLRGARVALSATKTVRADIDIDDGRMQLRAAPRVRSGQEIDLSGFLFLPGLVNAHDHLDFNLLPRLGNGPYSNWHHWAKDIYRPQESPVREERAIPRVTRLWWGGIKNLLCGATTVCHHDPAYPEIYAANFPVRVAANYGWAHSPDDPLAVARARTPNAAAFFVHAGEGKDDAARQELRVLDRAGVLDHRAVLIHGVAFREGDLQLMRERGAALIWCPSSNLFTLGTTHDAATIAGLPRCALGNDSALTAAGDLLDEIRVAYGLGAAPELLYRLVTSAAAGVCRLPGSAGQIATGAAADLFAVPDQGVTPAETLVSCSYRDVELVLVGGEVRCASPYFRAQTKGAALQPLAVDDVVRWIAAPVVSLLDSAAQRLGEVRLAHKHLSAVAATD